MTGGHGEQGIHTGRCLCGQVRYAFAGPVAAVNCRCRMCQRASGAEVSTWVSLRGGPILWTGAPPRFHRASPHALRAFCGACGSRIAMIREDSGLVSVTVGTLDRPDAVMP